MKRTPLEFSLFTYPEKTVSVFLIVLGTALFFLVAGCLLGTLLGGPVGSAGAIENLVGAYMEHALCCLIIPLAAAALIKLLSRA